MSETPSCTYTTTEKDDLLSFQLRGRLAEINFYHIWKVIQHQGWKFSSGEYITPDGINLGSSMEAMEILDSFALECLRFRQDGGKQPLKSYSRLVGMDEKALKALEDTRKSTLTAIFKDCKAKNSLLPCFYFDDDESDSDSGSCVEETKEGSGRKIPSRMSTVNKSRASATSNEPGTEKYFSKKKQQKGASDESIIKITREDEDGPERSLKWPNPRNCVAAVRSMTNDDSDDSEAEDVESGYLDQYSSEWKFLMSTNHSLLLHGYGSKIKMLNTFASKELHSSGDVLTLNGFDPGINISQILHIVVQLFLNGIEPSPEMNLSSEESNSAGIYEIGMLRTPHRLQSTIVQRAISIGKALGARHPKPIYIVLHNIDGVGLRSKESQKALSALVVHSTFNVAANSKDGEFNNSRVVRIAASVDHVDAPLFLWDVETSNNFSWIWKEVNTRNPYFDEVKVGIVEEARQMKASERQTLDFVFMKKVLKSLAPKHTAILKVLARMQLEEGKNTPSLCGQYECVHLRVWKRKCFDNMDVSQSAEFQSMVKELSDHNMIQIQTDETAGRDFVCIPTKRAKVIEIMKLLN